MENAPKVEGTSSGTSALSAGLGVLPMQELLDLRRDALRFRWLSDGNRGDHIRDWINFHSPTMHKTLGEAIDAALTPNVSSAT